MHTGQRNPLQLPEDEQYDRLSTQLSSCTLVQSQSKLFFHEWTSSNNIFSFDYEAHIKNVYSIKHYFLNKVCW